ncbi:MAG: aconitate hydratase [Bdellovibrionales bacterium]|nr:aconitate hydratase [Bdellovibrionales bacterium]
MDIETTAEMLRNIYEKSRKNLGIIKQWHSNPMTLTEKVLFSHLCHPQKEQKRGLGFLSLQPDRVAMQDVTAQMALLQFMLAGKEKTAVPTTVHCDHLIQAWKGSQTDTQKSLEENNEVFQFLSSACSCFGLGFWKPGAGIIHQVILENYAFPGGLLIGTDSHTPNAGGLGMLAVGVGGADAADVMAGMPWEVKNPGITGVHLTGKLKGWTSPKDIILKLLGILTVKGGTNKIIEYFGEGCSTLSCTGKATITNMGAELGATCSVFPYDDSMSQYLEATYRLAHVKVIESYKELFSADPKVIENPHAYYDEVIEIDLSTLEPQLAGPHSPDAVTPLSKVKELCQKEKWPVQLSAALIGSCTNSSYEDIGRSAHIARQAREAGFKMPQHFLVTPGSELIRQTIERDGYIKDFEDIGAVVLANACGPCIGQWKREYKKGQVNTIVNSFNRNFRGRNDANPETLSFIASPEITIALGLAGRLDFNPQTDFLEKDGKQLKLHAPEGDILPTKGFSKNKEEGYEAPKGKNILIKVNPQSERLQLLKPFPSWNKESFQKMLILCKAKGKCTTDHISPAGFWLRYRGHLDRISDNLLIGATNAFTNERGTGLNLLTGETQPFSQIARYYKSQKRAWVIIGDENYGEGSSREHAAMTPRYLGAKAVIVKSFARIHETNLKKQGVLPLVFARPEDKEKLKEKDQLDILDLENLKPHSQHTLLIHHEDGSQEECPVLHSMNEDQIKWFKAGSALNLIRQ